MVHIPPVIFSDCSINQSTVLFHHTNIKIKAQTYTVTNIITATPVKVKQKSNIYIVIIETFQEQEQTRKQSLLGGLHQFNIESKNEREQTRNCSNWIPVKSIIKRKEVIFKNLFEFAYVLWDDQNGRINTIPQLWSSYSQLATKSDSSCIRDM